MKTLWGILVQLLGWKPLWGSPGEKTRRIRKIVKIPRWKPLLRDLGQTYRLKTSSKVACVSTKQKDKKREKKQKKKHKKWIYTMFANFFLSFCRIKDNGSFLSYKGNILNIIFNPPSIHFISIIHSHVITPLHHLISPKFKFHPLSGLLEEGLVIATWRSFSATRG